MGDVDPDLALFASWVRAEEGRERDSRRAAKVARDHERQAQDLVRAKDLAAAELKRVRQDPRAGAEAKATADAAYREALAAVVTAETGAPPEWAPPVPVEEVPVAAPADEDPSTDEPSSDEPASDEPATDEPATDDPATDEAPTDPPAGAPPA